jgi:hypothetical protein
VDDKRDNALRSISRSVSRVHTGRGAVPLRTIFGPVSCKEERLLEAYLSLYRLTLTINKLGYIERRLQGSRVSGRRRRGVDSQRRARNGGRSCLPGGHGGQNGYDKIVIQENGW